MMVRIRDFLAKFTNTLSLAVAEAIVGIFLLISPPDLAIGILWLCGVLLVADAVVRCITYFKEPIAEAKRGHKFASGIFFLVCGLFLLFNYRFVVDIFPVLAALYAMIVMISVFLKLELVVTGVREKNATWYVMAVSFLFSLIAMMILYGSRFPFIAAGIFLLLAAVTDALYELNAIGKLRLPALSELKDMVTGKIARSSKKDIAAAAEMPGAEQVTNTEAAADPAPAASSEGDKSVPDQTQDPADSIVTEPIDPADEDMSWAHVPQLEMPD